MVESKIKFEKMSLDDAIKHTEKVADECEVKARLLETPHYTKKSMENCANEHRQLAEWLKELKALRKEMEQTRLENEVLKAEKSLLLTWIEIAMEDVDDWTPVIVDDWMPVIVD